MQKEAHLIAEGPPKGGQQSSVRSVRLQPDDGKAAKQRDRVRRDAEKRAAAEKKKADTAIREASRTGDRMLKKIIAKRVTSQV